MPLKKPVPCVLNTAHPLVDGRSLRFALPFNETVGAVGPVTEVHDLIQPTLDGVMNSSGTSIIDVGVDPYAHAGRTGTSSSDAFGWTATDSPTFFPGGTHTHGTLAILGKVRSGGSTFMFDLGGTGSEILLDFHGGGGTQQFGASGEALHWTYDGAGGIGTIAGTWHLWHLVRDGANLTLYMDGLPAPTGAGTGVATRNDLTTGFTASAAGAIEVGGLIGFTAGNIDISDVWTWLGGAEAVLSSDEMLSHASDPWQMYRYAGFNPIARIFGGTHANQIVGRNGVKVTPVADVPVPELFVEIDAATFPGGIVETAEIVAGNGITLSPSDGILDEPVTITAGKYRVPVYTILSGVVDIVNDGADIIYTLENLE